MSAVERLRVALLAGLDVPLARSARSAALPSPATHSLRRSGRCSFRLARARCSAQLTEATVVSSSSAVSFARQPRTSRRISTARGRGGEVLDRDMNASSIVSRATTTRRAPRPLGRDRRQQLVRVGLQPRDLAARGRYARALLQRVQARVGRDPVQPGAQRRAPRVGRARAPRAQERLLREVLGLLEGAEHPVAVQLQLAPVALDERREAGLVGQLESGHASVTAIAPKTHRRVLSPRPAMHALEIHDLVKRYPTGTEALKGVVAGDRGGRVLRPARAQRRRQVDADPLHDRASRSRPSGSIRVFGHDAVAPLRRGAHGGRARAAGAQPRLVPHARGDARLPRRLLRDAAQGPPRAHQGAARGRSR